MLLTSLGMFLAIWLMHRIYSLLFVQFFTDPFRLFLAATSSWFSSKIKPPYPHLADGLLSPDCMCVCICVQRMHSNLVRIIVIT